MSNGMAWHWLLAVRSDGARTDTSDTTTQHSMIQDAYHINDHLSAQQACVRAFERDHQAAKIKHGIHALGRV